MEKSLIEIRKLLADYMFSEGCGCCQDDEAHAEAKEKLAKILEVPMYEDKSGYDFYKFTSKKQQMNGE